MPDQLTPRCPAAEAIGGPVCGGPSIVCRIMQREGQAQDGILEGAGQEHLLVTTDPSLVLGFCCGTAYAPISLEGEARAHYAFCPIWQAERKREEEAKARAWESRPRLHLPDVKTIKTPFDEALAEVGL